MNQAMPKIPKIKTELFKELRPNAGGPIKAKTRIDMGNGVIRTVPEIEKVKEIITERVKK